MRTGNPQQIVLLGAEGSIEHLCFHPSRPLVCAVTSNGHVVLWDLKQSNFSSRRLSATVQVLITDEPKSFFFTEIEDSAVFCMFSSEDGDVLIVSFVSGNVRFFRV